MIMFFHLKFYFQGAPRPFLEGEIWFIIITTILGLLFYRLQKNRLKLKSIYTILGTVRFSHGPADLVAKLFDNGGTYMPF